MSAVLRSKILTQLEKAVKGNNSQVTQRILNNHITYASTSKIRSDTDANAESVLSRGGLEQLKKDMQIYLNENSTTILTEAVINNLNFDGFKTFLLNKYYTGNEEPGRVEAEFKYSTPIRLTGSRKSTKLIIGTNTSGDASRDVLILKNIAYDKIVEYFKEYILQNLSGISDADKKNLIKYMSGMFNAGHLVGAFTGRLIRAFDIKKDKSTGNINISGSSDPELVAIMNTVLELVTAADLLSSNIYSDVELFARSEKQLTKSSAKLRFVTEVQVSSNNKEAGNMLAQAGNELTKLLKSLDPINSSQKSREIAVGEYTKKLFLKLKPLQEYVRKRSAQLLSNSSISPELEKKLKSITQSIDTYDLLLSTSGSDPVLKHIGNVIANAIDKKVKVNTGNSIAAVSKLLKPAKNNKKAAGKVHKTTKAVKIRQIQSQSIILSNSLTSLQNLLSANLSEKIKQNMGNGSRRDILNLRTGRFAESAKVERISESRAGMLTVFYSYMKYPYQTFEPGFKQGSPASRNPKLLIAKSIRDIAGQIVANRLRSVSV